VSLEDYDQVWVYDFEYHAPEGETPSPICVAAKDFLSGEIIALWLDGVDNPAMPYDTSSKSLFVSYNEIAEASCHLALGWDRPENIIDLFVEYLNFTNGKYKGDKGLLEACNYFGINDTDAATKEVMRGLCIRGAPFTQQEKDDILRYCISDVEVTTQLLRKMWGYITRFPPDEARARLRGRYMWSLAVVEREGIPIDTELLIKLERYWKQITPTIIAKVDEQYNIFENGVFKIQNFVDYLNEQKIPWEATPSGRPRTDDDYLKDMVKSYPQLRDLRELRVSLSQLRKRNLIVGSDGKNRVYLAPFRAKTGRNQPSSTKYVFGNSVWLRGLIKPATGMSIAYIDYEQQEFCIAAALSGDVNMITAYNSGDPYLAFAKQCGAVPEDATKASHPEEREAYKQCCLALNYGMGVENFARRINQPLSQAKLIYKQHQQTYAQYWKWAQFNCDTARLGGIMSTTLGWNLYTQHEKHRTLLNFPQQSMGGEMLRLAVCDLVNYKIRVCGTIHDAVLITDSGENISYTVKKAEYIMENVSRKLLHGITVRTETEIINHPDRFVDPRGESMWNTVMKILQVCEAQECDECHPIPA